MELEEGESPDERSRNEGKDDDKKDSEEVLCCGVVVEFSPPHECRNLASNSHRCIICKKNVCKRCIAGESIDGSVLPPDEYGEAVICTQHTRDAIRPLNTSTTPTNWDLLLRQHRRNLLRTEIVNEPHGTEIPCYRQLLNGKGDGDVPATSQWWAKTILYNVGDGRWSVNDEQGKFIEYIDESGTRGLSNVWTFNFKYPSAEEFRRISTTSRPGAALDSSQPKTKRSKSSGMSNVAQKYYAEAALNDLSIEEDDDESSDKNWMNDGYGASTTKSNTRVKKRQNNSFARDERLPPNRDATTSRTTTSHVDDDDDDDESLSPMPGYERVTPKEFMQSLGDLMTTKLNKNKSRTNPFTYEDKELKEILCNIADLRKDLREGAAKLDGEVDGESLYDLVARTIRTPDEAKKKQSKKAIVKHLVLAYSTTQYLVGSGDDQITWTKGRRLQSYNNFYKVMSQIELLCHADKAKESVPKEYRSLPLGMDRGFMEGDAKRWNRPCACCGCEDGKVDEPPSNKEKRKSNRQKQTQYKRDARLLEKQRKEGGTQLDGEGNRMKKLKEPSLEDEVVECHCGQNPETTCKCRFVCPKE